MQKKMYSFLIFFYKIIPQKFGYRLMTIFTNSYTSKKKQSYFSFKSIQLFLPVQLHNQPKGTDAVLSSSFSTITSPSRSRSTVTTRRTYIPCKCHKFIITQISTGKLQLQQVWGRCRRGVPRGKEMLNLSAASDRLK